MSFSISTSESPNDIWMVRNSMSRWFVRLFATRYASQSDLTEQLEMALCVHGISFDDLYIERPEFALRIRDALRRVANEIAGGHHVICVDTDPVVTQDRSAAHFGELVKILDRWQP